MKYFVLILIALLTSQLALAKKVKVRIDSIDLGKNGEPHLLLLSDGNVGRVPFEDELTLKAAKMVQGKEDLMEVHLDKYHYVMGIQSLDIEGPIPHHEDLERECKDFNYNPTVLSSYAAANTIFRRMNPHYQSDSQCYNRAHVWAYEEWKRSGLMSNKLFIFFTRRYIRNYNYFWWFHAIPATLVKEGASTVMRTLDYRYSGSPLYVRTWSNIFVRSHRNCPFITKYSQYSMNQETQDCYIHPSSMYFWQPRDLDTFERTGYQKTSFIESEVDYAYWEAF